MITLKTNISKLKRHEINPLNDCLLKVCTKELGSKKGLDINYTEREIAMVTTTPSKKRLWLTERTV